MDKNRLVIKILINNAKSIIAISKRCGFSCSKERLLEFCNLGESIIANNFEEELVDKYLELYRTLDRNTASPSIEDSVVSSELLEVKDDKSLNDVHPVQRFLTQADVTYNNLIKLNRERLEKVLYSLRVKIDSIDIASIYDKSIWGDYSNYDAYLILFNKIKSTLDDLVTIIPDYSGEHIEKKEAESLAEVLKCARNSINELEKIAKQRYGIVDLSSCTALSKQFSDLLVNYIIVNYKSSEKGEKHI